MKITMQSANNANMVVEFSAHAVEADQGDICELVDVTARRIFGDDAPAAKIKSFVRSLARLLIECYDLAASDLFAADEMDDGHELLLAGFATDDIIEEAKKRGAFVADSEIGALNEIANEDIASYMKNDQNWICARTLAGALDSESNSAVARYLTEDQGWIAGMDLDEVLNDQSDAGISEYLRAHDHVVVDVDDNDEAYSDLAAALRDVNPAARVFANESDFIACAARAPGIVETIIERSGTKNFFPMLDDADLMDEITRRLTERSKDISRLMLCQSIEVVDGEGKTSRARPVAIEHAETFDDENDKDGDTE
jgi:hypothetical protein